MISLGQDMNEVNEFDKFHYYQNLPTLIDPHFTSNKRVSMAPIIQENNSYF